MTKEGKLELGICQCVISNIHACTCQHALYVVLHSESFNKSTSFGTLIRLMLDIIHVLFLLGRAFECT